MKKMFLFLVSQLLFAVIGVFAYHFRDMGISLIPMILLSIPAYYALVRVNLKRGVLFILLLSLYATGIEALSIQTGWPYGYFVYNENLGHKLFDVVPWAVGFGWVPLVIGAFFLAQRVFSYPMVRFISGVVILVLVDLVLDPGAVALEFWTWKTIGMYYTVPFVNYLGWVFSGIVGGFAWFLFGFHNDEVSPMSALTLLYGNAFWIGVTLMAGFYVASIIGLLLHLFAFFVISTPVLTPDTY